MPDSSTTAIVLGATSIVCGTVLAPVIAYHIQKDRYHRESLIDVRNSACQLRVTRSGWRRGRRSRPRWRDR